MNNTIKEAHDLLKTAGFDYAVCGGYGLDMLAGKELRAHGDFDIMIFKEDKHHAVRFFMDRGWTVYGRFMEDGKPITQHLFYKINDITDSYWDDCKNMWVLMPGCATVLDKVDRLQGEVYTYKPRKWLVQDLEFIELEFDAREGGDYVARDNPRITRPLEKAILYRDGIPYLAPEVILFYKSDKFSSEHPNVKPKTDGDFNTIMPMLSEESRQWLLNAIDTAYPGGYEWLEATLCSHAQ